MGPTSHFNPNVEFDILPWLIDNEVAIMPVTKLSSKEEGGCDDDIEEDDESNDNDDGDVGSFELQVDVVYVAQA